MLCRMLVFMWSFRAPVEGLRWAVQHPLSGGLAIFLRSMTLQSHM